VLARPNLEKIARQADLLIQVSNPLEEQRLYEHLSRSIEITGTEQDLYTIAYASESPEKAQRVVQAVLNVLMEETLGSSRADSMAATNFLEHQVQEYENRLQAAEQRLAEFKRENVGLLPEQAGSDFYQRLRQGEEVLRDLESQMQTAQNRRDAVLADLEAMRSGQAASSLMNPRVEALDQQLRAATQRLNDLLLRYTDSHPDVIALRDQIERLRQERQQAIQQPMASAPADLSTNPVYQELQIRLNTLNTEIAALEPKISNQRERLDQLRSSIDEITAVETRLADLTRTYDVTRERYQALLSRLNSARLSGDVEASGSQVRFQIVDPPVVPVAPDGPPRDLYLLLLIPVSLGVGAGVAFFLHQLKPVFQSRTSLAEWTGRPVLGAVSLAMTRSQRRMELGKAAGFAAATLVLVLAVAIGALFANDGAQALQAAMRGI
jgi:polysaccharide chain length determinant protein (PEP-CTERM system associated)